MGPNARTRLCSLLAPILAACGVSPARNSDAPQPTGVAEPTLRTVLDSLVDMDGAALDLGDRLRQGKTLALVFWQPWCAACRREAPRLAAAQQQFRRQLQVVGVVSGPNSVVDDDEVRRTAIDLGLLYPQVRDRDLHLTKLLQVTETPTIVLLDRELHVTYRGHYPPTDWSTVLEAH